MSSSKVGVALLGAGIFAVEGHAPVILNSPLLDLKAIWSRSAKTVEDAKAAPQLKDAGDLQTYSGDDGLKELLDRSDIQAVIIALPIPNQPAIIKIALEAGKHVLSEKPIASNVKTAKELVELYEARYKPQGISWRVAENWAHEPATHELARLVASPDTPLGPVLYYEVRFVGHIPMGWKYQKTAWRSVPQHQGGFLMDGGVHAMSMLRIALGEAAPTHMIAHAHLHRTYLGPHDTFTAITSTPAISRPPLGPDVPQSNLPTGKSSPSGTLVFTCAAAMTSSPVNTTMRFAMQNGNVVISQRMGEWDLTVETVDAKVTEFAGKSAEKGGQVFKVVGVEEEVKQFAEAVLGQSEGKVNWGEPRGALWDVAAMEAGLTSEGRLIELTAL